MRIEQQDSPQLSCSFFQTSSSQSPLASSKSSQSNSAEGLTTKQSEPSSLASSLNNPTIKDNEILKGALKYQKRLETNRKSGKLSRGREKLRKEQLEATLNQVEAESISLKKKKYDLQKDVEQLKRILQEQEQQKLLKLQQQQQQHQQQQQQHLHVSEQSQQLSWRQYLSNVFSPISISNHINPCFSLSPQIAQVLPPQDKKNSSFLNMNLVFSQDDPYITQPFSSSSSWPPPSSSSCSPASSLQPTQPVDSILLSPNQQASYHSLVSNNNSSMLQQPFSLHDSHKHWIQEAHYIHPSAFYVREELCEDDPLNDGVDSMMQNVVNIDLDMDEFSHLLTDNASCMKMLQDFQTNTDNDSIYEWILSNSLNESLTRPSALFQSSMQQNDFQSSEDSKITFSETCYFSDSNLDDIDLTQQQQRKQRQRRHPNSFHASHNSTTISLLAVSFLLILAIPSTFIQNFQDSHTRLTQCSITNQQQQDLHQISHQSLIAPLVFDATDLTPLESHNSVQDYDPEVNETDVNNNYVLNFIVSRQQERQKHQANETRGQIMHLNHENDGSNQTMSHILISECPSRILIFQSRSKSV